MVTLSPQIKLADKYFKELDWQNINPYDKKYYIALAGALIYKSNPLCVGTKYFSYSINNQVGEILNLAIKDIRITDVSSYLNILLMACTICCEYYVVIDEKIDNDILKVSDKTKLNVLKGFFFNDLSWYSYSIKKSDTQARAILYHIYQLTKKMRYFVLPQNLIYYRENYIESPITGEKFFCKKIYGGAYRETLYYVCDTEDEYNEETTEKIENWFSMYKEEITNKITQKTYYNNSGYNSAGRLLEPFLEVGNYYSRGAFYLNCAICFGDCELLLPKGISFPTYLYVKDSRGKLFPPFIGPVKLPPRDEGYDYIIKFGHGENAKNSLYFKYDFEQVKMYKKILKFDKDFWKENPPEYDIENPEYTGDNLYGIYFQSFFSDISASGYFV